MSGGGRMFGRQLLQHLVYFTQAYLSLAQHQPYLYYSGLEHQLCCCCMAGQCVISVCHQPRCSQYIRFVRCSSRYLFISVIALKETQSIDPNIGLAASFLCQPPDSCPLVVLFAHSSLPVPVQPVFDSTKSPYDTALCTVAQCSLINTVIHELRVFVICCRN